MFAESFVFGILNGLHCAGMCGPLAACHGGGASAGVYQVSRLAGYALAGLAAGGVGGLLGLGGVLPGGALVSFVLAAALLGFALFGHGRMSALAGLPLVGRWFRAVFRLPRFARAAGVGLLTPLLPCGLLVGVYAAALAAGSAGGGALTMLGFASGSALPLVAAQVPLAWWSGRLSPAGALRLQRVLLTAAALVLLLRGGLALAAEPCCSHAAG
jgi:sulfite exporter TauE/SafE